MKKIFFSLAMLIAAGFSMNAQDIKFGVKGGVNFSNFSGDVDNADMRTGFHVGGFAEFKYGNFAIQPELLYTTAGAKTTGEIEGISGDITAKTSYIAVPIAAKYYIVDGLSLQAGPQFAFLTSSKAKFEGGGFEVEVDDNDSYKGFDLALFGGLGYEMESGLLFAARYVQGVTSIADGEGSDNVSVQNTTIQLSVGFKF